MSILTEPPGYKVTNTFLYRLWNFSLALVLFIMALPFFIVISFLLLITQGPSIFYSGPRYGQDRKLYNMYKFRTLKKEASQFTKDRLMTTRTNLETPLGKVLRRSRLDELPQILNVLRGDMNLIGPRPVRPEMFDVIQKDIPNYGVRFQVKPGIVGVAQSLLPHSAPKLLRHRLNLVLLKKETRFISELIFLARNALAIFTTVFQIFLEVVLHVKSKRIKNRRSTERVYMKNASIRLRDDKGVIAEGMVIDVNDEAFSFETTQMLQPDTYELDIELGCGKRISTICVVKDPAECEPVPGSNASHKRRYIAFFEFRTTFESYRVEHHVLKKALIS
ncbi:sugar transferase [Neptuniibacter sp. PT8_73]|uniref:sugar transferase n=2 Tax=unclassified Neptuniibacter TaxID=2630693 RepID=UPI0039F5D156